MSRLMVGKYCRWPNGAHICIVQMLLSGSGVVADPRSVGHGLLPPRDHLSPLLIPKTNRHVAGIRHGGGGGGGDTVYTALHWSPPPLFLFFFYSSLCLFYSFLCFLHFLIFFLGDQSRHNNNTCICFHPHESISFCNTCICLSLFCISKIFFF